jgi:hypothetical protein
MFKRLTWLLVAMLSFSLVLAACGDSPTAQTSGQGQNAQNQAAQLPTGVNSKIAGSFPDSTVLYITLNTDMNSGQIKGWQKSIEYLNGIPEFKNVSQNLDVLSLSKLGTYDADIKPWLGGELALGVSDLNALVGLVGGTNAAATGEIPVLMGAPITDQAKAEAFIAKMGGELVKAGMPAPTKETYKDANLYTFNAMFVNIVAGVSKDKLFIGGGPAVVKAAFDRTSDKSLASSANYKAVTAKLPSANLAFMYVDSPAVVKAVSNLPEAKAALDSMKSSLNLDYSGPQGVTFATADEGFRIDSYNVYYADKTPAAVAEMLKKGANPNKILSALPENTFFFGNSRDAVASYDLFLTSLKASAAASATTGTTGMGAADIDTALADFEKQTGLNLRNDIVSLFKDEYALFVAPSAQPKQFPVGLGLLAEATNKADVQAKLDKITAALEKAGNGEVKFENKTSGNTAYKSAAINDTSSSTPVQSSLNVGIVGNFAFFALGDDTTANVISAATGGKNLTNGANAASFTKTRDALPKDNTGYIYTDVQAIIKYVTQFVPAENQAQVKNYTDKLTKLYAIGAAGRQNQNEAASTMYIYFPVTK